VVFPLPPRTPGLPGWLPTWGRRLADRRRTIGQPGGLVSAEPKDGAHGSPPGKMMLSAENIGNFL
jgi:hypothetical protein